jgi:hypothetical protein
VNCGGLNAEASVQNGAPAAVRAAIAIVSTARHSSRHVDVSGVSLRPGLYRITHGAVFGGK